MGADETEFGDVAAHADGIADRRDEARGEVRAYVRALMAAMTPPMSRAQLAKSAAVDRDTVSDFLNGKSWPQPARLDAIERAIGAPQGAFDRLLVGEQPGQIVPQTHEPESAGSPLSEMVVRFTPDALSDLSPTEREEVEAAAKAAALQRIREIRGQ